MRQAALFPTGHQGIHRIAVGQWRDAAAGSMQVVSGPIGKETIHFIAPDAEHLEKEMQQFLEWFLDCLKRALNNAEKTLHHVLFRAQH